MAIHSMTGYASASRDCEAGRLTLEIKSVNSRFLDIHFKINDECRALEPVLREAIMQRIARGKVECRLSFCSVRHNGAHQIDISALEDLLALQNTVRQHDQNAPLLTMGDILKWPGVVQDGIASLSASQTRDDSEQLSRAAAELGREVLDELIATRAREGDAMAKVITDNSAAIEVISARLQPMVPELVAQYQQKASRRMAEALGLIQTDGMESPLLSQQEAGDRIRQEVTLYGIRIDVAEELARLQAHVREVNRVLAQGGQVGKRLDFLMQELNREANTLGSKAAARELADASIELKLLIDQIREQVQNLE